MKKILRVVLVLLILIISIIAFGYYNAQTDINEEGVPEGIFFELDPDTAQLIDHVRKIEEMIRLLADTEDVKVVNNGTMAFIRSERYGYRLEGVERLVWDSFAGDISDETGILLRLIPEEEAGILEIVDSLKPLVDTREDVVIDFQHMIAVIDVIYTDSADTDLKETYIDYMFGWGGDLETYLLEVMRYSDANNIDEEEALYAYVRSTIASQESAYFSQEDLYADIDGVHIEALMSEEGLLLSEAMELYYTSQMHVDRFDLFIESFGGAVGFSNTLNCLMLGEVSGIEGEDQEIEDLIESISVFRRLLLKFISGDDTLPNEAVREQVTKAFEEVILSQVE